MGVWRFLHPSLFPLTGKLAERTVEIAMEDDMTVYDASYVTLAEE